MLATPTNRALFLGLFLFCCGLMATGFTFQYAMHLEPCPLCITQRFFITLAGLFALIACLHNPRAIGTRVYSAAILFASVAGGAFSGRQLYLQSLPADQVPACGPGLRYMLEAFPLNKALTLLLKGDGNCAEVVWSFLGLSIPGWTLIAFAMIGATAIYLLVKAGSAQAR